MPKTYTAEDVIDAKLNGIVEGRAEAEKQLQGRTSKICRSNQRLLKELMRFDRSEPVAGVLIPYVFAQKLVMKLRDANKDDYHARMLKYYMNRTDRELLKIFKGVLREVDNE